LEEGIFACTVEVEGTTDRYLGAMHYGPRPVFRDTRACEVHLIDTQLLSTPAVVTITVFKRLREIRDFPSTEELSDQIALDIAACREILASA
jgi:FAD synthase